MFKYPIAVTIDTNVLDAARYDFSEGSPIILLENYVKKGKIKVVLSDIVVREAKKHISEQVNKVCGIARKQRTEVLKESTEYLIRYIGLDRLLELVDDKKSLITKSTELFDKFIKDINAEILGTDLIKLDTIIEDYFEINPPFEQGEKKRKEFPDAFIACQIRERFGDDEDVVIISNDKGLRKACKETPNHIFFESLGQLYDRINREEATYNETISIIEQLQFCIRNKVLEYIRNNENIDVRGLSYDKDGIESGFDYNEFYLHDISNSSFMVYSVDEMSDTVSLVTLLCKANISVNCFYEDYDNAPWDSETREHIFVDTIQMREDHNVRFFCRIELERDAKSFKIFPFTVILGGDSRKNRYEVEEEQLDIDYAQEIEDMDREALGFFPLGSYASYLEEDLPNSNMSEEIIKQFEEMNILRDAFADFSSCYDLLLEELDSTENARKMIKLISKALEEISDFPSVVDVESIEYDEIEKIKKWCEYKFNKASQILDQDSLPDTLEYGEKVFIRGVDGSELIFVINEIEISPEEGSEELIDVYLLNEQGEIARGYIKLTVGYLNFNEDGGAEDGIEDAIEYEYDEIIEKIHDYILKQHQLVEKETKIIKIIENAIDG